MIREKFYSYKIKINELIFDYFIDEQDNINDFEKVMKEILLSVENDIDFCCCYVVGEILSALKKCYNEKNLNRVAVLLEQIEIINLNLNIKNLLKDFINQNEESNKNFEKTFSELMELIKLDNKSNIINYFFIKKALNSLIGSSLYLDLSYREDFIFLRKEYNKYTTDNEFIEKIRLLNYFSC